MKMNRATKNLLFGVIIGVILGVSAYSLGLGSSCPSARCIDSARITPVNDRQYAQTALNLILSARKSIHIVAFEMKYYTDYPSSDQNKIVRQIIYAKERGVEVKIVVDEFSKEDNAYTLLLENGVDIRLDDKDQTTHAKLMIVDGTKVLIGSTNFSFYGLEKNREANVLIDDAVFAKKMIEYFDQLQSAQPIPGIIAVQSMPVGTARFAVWQ